MPHAIVEEKSKKSPGTIGLLDAASSTPRTLPAVVSSMSAFSTSLFLCHEGQRQLIRNSRQFDCNVISSLLLCNKGMDKHKSVIIHNRVVM